MSAEKKELPPNVSYLDLPDEELANYAPPPLVAAPAADKPEGEGASDDAANTDTTTKVEGEGAADDAKGEGDEASQATGTEAAQGAAGDAGAADAAKEPGTEATATTEKVEAPADKGKKDEKPAVEDTSIDYKAAYERLLAPFKANGRDIQVKDVDEAIQLMQMGANYNKKMAGLKPSLTLLKLLENNGLLNEEKISYLIDLDKKDPAAINKLVQEAGLDPMDLDPKKAEGYKPTPRKVDAREVELDAVMEEIQGTAAFQRTIEVVGKTWDQASRNLVADNPQVLKVINAQIESGIYDLITARVDRDRLFGRLSGLSDIEAYRQVGEAMNAAGEFNSLGRQEQPKTPQKTIVEPKPPKVDEEALKEKKRAASGTKPATPAAPAQDFNPLALSDEEFLKLGRLPA